MEIPPERERRYLEAQMRVLQDAGPHYRRDVGVAVARIQKRLDELDRLASPSGSSAGVIC